MIFTEHPQLHVLVYSCEFILKLRLAYDSSCHCWLMVYGTSYRHFPNCCYLGRALLNMREALGHANGTSLLEEVLRDLTWFVTCNTTPRDKRIAFASRPK